MQNELSKLVAKAKKAGGAHMTPAGKKRLFLNDSRLAKNVIAAAEQPSVTKAIKEGVVSDHRVMEELTKVGVVAARIIVELEEKLGRKLPRSRAKILVGNYLRIRNDRQSIQAVRSILAKFSATPCDA